MQAFQVAILLGLMAAVSWGVSDFLIGRSSKAAGAMKGALLINTYGALVYAAVFVLFLYRHASFTAEGMGYAAAGGVFFGLAQAVFFKAMNLGPVGLVSAVSSTFPLVTLLAGVALFAERLYLIQVLGILFIVGGVVVASDMGTGKPLKSTPGSRRPGRGPVVALAPAFGWGIGYVFIARGIKSMGWESTLLVELLVVPVALGFLVPFIRGSEQVAVKAFRARWLLPAVWGAAIIQMVGLLAVNLGLSKIPNNAAVVIAVSSCYPALTIFLAFRHLRERIPLAPLLGGLVSVAGVVLLSLG